MKEDSPLFHVVYLHRQSLHRGMTSDHRHIEKNRAPDRVMTQSPIFAIGDKD